MGPGMKLDTMLSNRASCCAQLQCLLCDGGGRGGGGEKDDAERPGFSSFDLPLACPRLLFSAHSIRAIRDHNPTRVLQSCPGAQGRWAATI